MNIVLKYFNEITALQEEQFVKMQDVYRGWNEKINLISRKDTDDFYTHHVLHSLAIAKIIDFLPNTNLLDVGTGGGFPTIPLAVMFPQVNFTAVDSIGKKIMALNEISKELGLTNVTADNLRAEKVKGKFDFVLGRAVTNLADFTGWVINKIANGNKHTLPNGIICLKGGDLSEEKEETMIRFKLKPTQISEYNIADFFEEEFFETKKILHIALK